MGQSESKEEKKAREIIDAAERIYDEHFKDDEGLGVIELFDAKKLKQEKADFYRAICEAVEELNKSLGNTQFRVPKKTTLQEAFEKHHRNKGKSLTRAEFQNILKDILWDTGFTGIGAKDILFYIFGVPITTLFIKKRLMPNVIPNEIFISGVTSATVFVLAKLHKI